MACRRSMARHARPRTAAASTFSCRSQSLRRFSQAEAAQAVPRRIDLVTAGASDTVQSLARRIAYSDAQVERFRALNGLGSGETVVAGQKYKIVVRGT